MLRVEYATRTKSMAIAAEDMAPCIARPTAVMVWTLLNEYIFLFVFHEERFQLPVPSQVLRIDRKYQSTHDTFLVHTNYSACYWLGIFELCYQAYGRECVTNLSALALIFLCKHTWVNKNVMIFMLHFQVSFVKIAVFGKKYVYIF